MKLGIFYSHPRLEEKMLFAAAEKDPEVELVRIMDDVLELDIHKDSPLLKCDVVLLRSVSHTKNYYAAAFLESRGKKAVNGFQTISVCGDKLLTSLALAKAKVPTPKTKACFDSEQALRTIDDWGYPVVLKPVIGSWGRLLSKINNRDSAETVLEHKAILGGLSHANLFYIQEYIEKKNQSDIRAIVIGNQIVAAMYRKSAHWITNTARGGQVQQCKVTSALKKVVLAAAKAVSPYPSLLGVDVVETKKGLQVVEVNSGVEFHGIIETTKVDIPGKMIEFLKSIRC